LPVLKPRAGALPRQSAHAAASDTDKKYLFNWTIEFLF